MAVLEHRGGVTLGDVACASCFEQSERVYVFTLADGDQEHHLPLCADCLARDLSVLTGFRFAGQLAAWRVTRATHQQLKAEKMARRGKHPVSP